MQLLQRKRKDKEVKTKKHQERISRLEALASCISFGATDTGYHVDAGSCDRIARLLRDTINDYERMGDHLETLQECNLTDADCASLAVVSARIRNIATSALL